MLTHKERENTPPTRTHDCRITAVIQLFDIQCVPPKIDMQDSFGLNEVNITHHSSYNAYNHVQDSE